MGDAGRGGAQTFRRGRALHFYEQLATKRETLKVQLEAKELQSIHPVIAGELKAIEMVMSEFKVAFKLDELMNKARRVIERGDFLHASGIQTIKIY